MKTCVLLAVYLQLILWTACSHADIIIRSVIQSTTGGRPGGQTLSTTKVKGKWSLSETKIEMPELPGGLQIPKSAARLGPQMSIKNMENGDTWLVTDGIAKKLDTTASDVMTTMAGAKPASPMAGASFQNTGRTEKVRDYDTEIWESSTKEATVTVWVAPALVHIKRSLENIKPKEGTPDAEYHRALAPLPGLVVKERIVRDMGRMLARSIPAGAKVPAGLASMKSVSLREVTEVRELAFSEEEFRLPEGVE